MTYFGEIYAAAHAQGLTVDHGYPLQGEFVSGLHVHQNLHPMPGSENFSKGNRS